MLKPAIKLQSHMYSQQLCVGKQTSAYNNYCFKTEDLLHTADCTLCTLSQHPDSKNICTISVIAFETRLNTSSRAMSPLLFDAGTYSMLLYTTCPAWQQCHLT